MAIAQETVLPLRGDVPLVTRFRSAWVAASIRTLRARRHFDAYEAALSSSDRDALIYAQAGTWLDAPLVIRHYEACDRLWLAVDEIFAIGASVTVAVQGSVLSRTAQSLGVTPWTIFGQLDRLWDRVMDGGGVGVTKLGPKDARIELGGFPLAGISYNRIATRGIVHAIASVVCRRAFVSELPALCSRTTLAYNVSWA